MEREKWREGERGGWRGRNGERERILWVTVELQI